MFDATRRIDMDEVTSWVRSWLPAAGPLKLFQAEPWATVFQVPLGEEFAWFKACEPHQSFEVPLTASLSTRWSTVTEVVAHDVDRRWLLMADAGDPLRKFGNPPQRWLEILPSYAELQRAETAYAEKHLANGVPNLGLELLPSFYEELLRAELPLEAGEKSALAAFLPTFARLCRELGTLGIESTLQHDDLHMNNVYVRNGELRILDWGDASIAHPFFSLFETFRFLSERNRLPPDDARFTRLRDAYLEPWGSDQRATFDLSLRIGGFAHAIAWLHQRDSLAKEDVAKFETSFSVILRLAMRGARDSWPSWRTQLEP